MSLHPRAFSSEAERPALLPRLATALEIASGRWPLWVAAAIIGGAVAALLHIVLAPTSATYPDFVIGFNAVAGMNKTADTAMLFGFFAAACGFFAATALQYRRLASLGGPQVLDDVSARFAIAVIPAFIWAAAFVFPRDANLSLFWCAAAFVTATSVALCLALLRPHLWTAHGNVRPLFDTVVLLPVAAMLAFYAVTMIGDRVRILYGPPWLSSEHTLHRSVFALGLGGLVLAAGLALTAGRADRFASRARTLLIILQALLPGLFLAILPAPNGPVGGLFTYLYPLQPSVWILLVVLSIALWADLIRLWRRGARDNDSPASAVSIVTLIAVLVYFRAPIPDALSTPMDDYHAGEDFVPWWSWIKHGLVPLWDFTPPRGLINYKLGLAGSLFTSADAGGMLVTVPILFALTMLAVFPPVALAVGKWPAFLLLSVATLDERLGDIDALITGALAVLVWAWPRRSHTMWLLLWFVVGTAAVLMAPGQGGLLVLATAPGGLWRLYQAWRGERPRLLRVAAITVAISAVLALVTPLGLMVAGAVRYGAGQSAVNGIANGIPWETGFGTIPGAAPWLTEVLRFSWLGVGAIALILLVRASARRDISSQARFLGLTVVLLCLLYIVRSGVRLDAGFIGRPGWTSLWTAALLLPMVLLAFLPQPRRLGALIVCATLAATMTGQFGLFGLDWGLMRPLIHQPPPTRNIQGGVVIGMPNLGFISMEPAHVQRLVNVKHTLDTLLDPTETFLDMTNNGAQYFYFNRTPPSDLSAFYNMITPAQQLRAVLDMERKHVPVALINADTILTDGLSASLRAYLVYRHLVLNFKPVRIDGYDYMLRTDRFARARLPLPGRDEVFTLLDLAFARPSLDRLPMTLGQSAASLAERMHDVMPLENARALAETKPAAFDLARPLRGQDAGLLRFDLACTSPSRGETSPTLAVHWREDGGRNEERRTVRLLGYNGTLIVPLDVEPTWLLGEAITHLEIAVEHADGCREFDLTHITLAQRTEVEEMKRTLSKVDSK